MSDSNTKFTPGPWWRDDRQWGDKWQIRGMANGTWRAPHKCDAVICSVNNNLLEADANAGLITAVPELYEALEHIADNIAKILAKEGWFGTLYIHPEMEHLLMVLKRDWADPALAKAGGGDPLPGHEERPGA
ncbi:MAG: hypothetical protein IJS15_14590 [Victivallales bacterium]|nr:hypothetical protein [Victivallales bacterium]